MKKTTWIILSIAFVVCAVGGILFGVLWKPNDTKTVTYQVADAFNSNEFSSEKVKIGESLDEKTILPQANNKMFLGWFLDANFKNEAIFPLVVEEDVTLYAKFLNGTFDASSFSYDAESDSYFIVKNSELQLQTVMVVPDFFDDGEHGVKEVSKISDGISADETLIGNNSVVQEIYIGHNVSYLGAFFASNSTELTKIYMGDLVSEFPTENSSAFSNCEKLEDVKLSASMTEIPTEMFSNTGVLNLNFLIENITSIENQAFYSCQNLTEATIPQSVKTIGENAFGLCENLETVKLHSDLDLASLVFDQTKFEENVLDKAVPCYDDIEKFIFLRASADLVDTTTIENFDKIIYVADYAFTPRADEIETNSLTTVDLPTCEILGEGAFSDCANLTTASIPLVETISQSAFENCKNLGNVTMTNAKYIEAAAFQNCYDLTIELPEGLIWIADYAFNHCSNSTQTEIVIPASLVQLGGREFVGPNNENEILGTHIFSDCATSTLTQFVVAEGNENFEVNSGVLYTKDFKYLVSYPSARTSSYYNISNGCVDLFQMSFSRAFNLRNLNIPNSLVLRVGDDKPENFADGAGNSLNDAIGCFTAINSFAIVGDNENYISMGNCLYTADGTELVAVPTRCDVGDTLLIDKCQKILKNPFYYHQNGAKLNINGKEVGGMPSQLIIGEQVSEISDEVLAYINSFVRNDGTGWVVVSNSVHFNINGEGKLERVIG